MKIIHYLFDNYNVVIELFFIAIMCGMVTMIEYRNIWIKELREENKDLRKIIWRKSKRKST